MSVVNKVRSGMHSITAPYIVTHNPSLHKQLQYVDSASQACRYLCRDGLCVTMQGAVMESILLVCGLCLPLPSLHLCDFYEIFLLLVCVHFYESMQFSRSPYSGACFIEITAVVIQCCSQPWKRSYITLQCSTEKQEKFEEANEM